MSDKKVTEQKGSNEDFSFSDSAMKRIMELMRGGFDFMKPATKDIEEHKFWKDQPVMKDKSVGMDALGPIEEKTVDMIQVDPYELPAGLVWSDIKTTEKEDMDELYNLLTLNYVEDDNAVFRFDYSREFLEWALHPPGYKNEWLIGVRAEKTKELVAFISGVPATLRSYTKTVPGVEINFLCIHKRLRAQRLAPTIIKEVTRRVNLHDIWHAAYTAGTVLPTPIGSCRYYHRSLNPKKLVEVGFSYKQPSITMAQYQKKYRLNTDNIVAGFRPMTMEDVPQAHKLFEKHQEMTQYTQVFSEEEFAHWLLPRKDVITSYVREVDGKVTDMFSYYYLPSSVSCPQAPQHKNLNAVYSFYNVATSMTFTELMEQALIVAKNAQVDVYNALELMENPEMFDKLLFAAGDGVLSYYMYNWQCPVMKPTEVGLVLL